MEFGSDPLTYADALAFLAALFALNRPRNFMPRSRRELASVQNRGSLAAAAAAAAPLSVLTRKGGTHAHTRTVEGVKNVPVRASLSAKLFAREAARLFGPEGRWAGPAAASRTKKCSILRPAPSHKYLVNPL